MGAGASGRRVSDGADERHSAIPTPDWFAPQSLELVHGPSNEVLVDAQCEGIQLGAIEGSVVADPASNLRVHFLSETGQVRATATVEVPALIFWPTAFFALALIAGEKFTNKPLGPRATRPRKV